MESSKLTETQTRSIYETRTICVTEGYERVDDMVETTHPSKVAFEMKQLLKEYRANDYIAFEDVIDFHYRFEKIHPFQDGNGRMGILIMFKECLKHNISSFVIENLSKEYYRRELKEYLTEKDFFVETCRAVHNAYKKRWSILSIYKGR